MAMRMQEYAVHANYAHIHADAYADMRMKISPTLSTYSCQKWFVANWFKTWSSDLDSECCWRKFVFKTLITLVPKSHIGQTHVKTAMHSESLWLYLYSVFLHRKHCSMLQCSLVLWHKSFHIMYFESQACCSNWRWRRLSSGRTGTG